MGQSRQARFLTPGLRKQICDAYRHGDHTVLIMQRYDVCSSTLHRILREEGVERRRWAAPPLKPRPLPDGLVRMHTDSKEVIASYRNGATLKQIGQRYGVSPSAVSRFLYRHGVAVRPCGPNQAYVAKTMDAEARAMLDEKTARLAATVPMPTQLCIVARFKAGVSRHTLQRDYQIAPVVLRAVLDAHAVPYEGGATAVDISRFNDLLRDAVVLQYQKGIRLNAVGLLFNMSREEVKAILRARGIKLSIRGGSHD